jgi:hypothetical protein
MMRRLMLAGLFVAAIAPAAVAQDSTSLIASDRASSAELAKIVDATRASGLPVEPILTYIRYGVLVHASGGRIVAAARTMAARLEEARSALAPNPSLLDIAAGEGALSANVSSRSLQDIRKVSGNRPLAVPLGVLTQLVANNVEEKRATKIVTDLMRKNATADQLVAFGNDVSSDINSGTKPNSAVEIRTNRLSAVLGVPVTGAAVTTGDFAAASPQPPGGKKKP